MDASDACGSGTTTRWAPQIIDTTNLTVHDVVDSESGSVSTGTGPLGTKVGGGQTLHLYAVFAAPPQDVATVTVKPADGAPAFTGETKFRRSGETRNPGCWYLA